MKSNFSIVLLAALVILVQGDFAAVADVHCQSANGVATNAWSEKACSEAPSNKPAAVSTDIYLAGDSDRGCCVLKTPEAKCVYTNKAFCTRKAKQANVGFEFHNGVECKAISACR